MEKYLKYTIYINLVIAILSTYMAFNFWETDRNRAYIFIFLAVITAFMFFFRRHYYKKFEERKRNNK
ncbi:hypothetical protein [Flagellimonas sp.]|uniref:hypothetical protein n=1 Tax=Flagellimonas sp. TaxID=2058762 RepID=UPI003F4A8104